MEDLFLLQSSGSATGIILAREQGIPVIGICGGYQMLGNEIIDEGFESCQGRYAGLGLLRVTTRFSRYEKVTEQVQRTARSAGPILSHMGSVKGYEIHMGETERSGDDEAFDQQFRNTLKQVYETLGAAAPVFLDVPIISLAPIEADIAASGLITVTVDGYASSGESFSISDANEAWILEMIGKGKVERVRSRDA